MRIQRSDIEIAETSAENTKNKLRASGRLRAFLGGARRHAPASGRWQAEACPTHGQAGGLFHPAVCGDRWPEEEHGHEWLSRGIQHGLHEAGLEPVGGQGKEYGFVGGRVEQGG